MMLINDIPANAPLFRKAPKEDLAAVIKHLHEASYHYADDSGREWELAKQHVADAANILNKLQLPFRAICEIQNEAKPLMPLDDIVDAVLAAAREAK